MKKKTKRIIIAAVVVSVLAGGAVTYSVLTTNAAQASKFSTAYGTDVARKGDISLTVSGSGNLESGDLVTISASRHIDVDQLLVSAGDTVEAGQDIATLDIAKMKDYAANLKTQITADANSINTSNTKPTTFRITSPVDGWVKKIVLGDDDSIETAMNKYGYVALVSKTKKEIINAEGKGLEQGDKVKVKCQGYTYTGTVIKKSNILYVCINTTYRKVGASATVYTNKGEKIFTGKIELYSYQPILSNYGTIDDVLVSENDSVSSGDVIYSAEQNPLDVKNLYTELKTLQAEYKDIEDLINGGKLTASSAGIINTLTITNGTTYEEGAALYTLASPEKWIATASIDEVDINSIKEGQNVNVTLDAVTGKTFNGKVSRISSVGTASGGVTTYNVDIAVDSDPSFKVGMSATCEITSQDASGVVMVPVTDVKSINSKSYVMVEVKRTDAEKEEIKQLISKNDYAGLSKYMGADAETLGIARLTDMTQLLYGEVRAVETGIENETYIEIKSGLSEGEKILAQTTSTSNNSNRNFMMGGMGAFPGGGNGNNRTGNSGRTGGSNRD